MSASRDAGMIFLWIFVVIACTLMLFCVGWLFFMLGRMCRALLCPECCKDSCPGCCPRYGGCCGDQETRPLVDVNGMYYVEDPTGEGQEKPSNTVLSSEGSNFV